MKMENVLYDLFEKFPLPQRSKRSQAGSNINTVTSSSGTDAITIIPPVS
jgi:hypothetical protein